MDAESSSMHVHAARQVRGFGVYGLTVSAAVVAIPLLFFGVLKLAPDLDPTFGAAGSHTLVVGAISAMAMVLAISVIVAARTLPDARTLFLAVGFLAMATIFLAHGLGTAPFLNDLV